MIESILDKTELSEEEKNRLVGEICAQYERLRYNGSRKDVMEIYEAERTPEEDHYIYEKTTNYFRGGNAFASALDIHYSKNLGALLRRRAM
tara:strand:+ start:375 stop:647 length:273 start_codon:yes stop_codon:yes gene_type:complete